MARSLVNKGERKAIKIGLCSNQREATERYQRQKLNARAILIIHQTQLYHHFRHVPPCFAYRTALLSSPVLSFHHLGTLPAERGKIKRGQPCSMVECHSLIGDRGDCLLASAFLDGSRVVVLLSGCVFFFLFSSPSRHFAVMKAENNLDRETCVISAGRQAGKLPLTCIHCQATVPGAFCLVSSSYEDEPQTTHRHKYNKSVFSCYFCLSSHSLRAFI